jgi:hypothetical protein
LNKKNKRKTILYSCVFTGVLLAASCSTLTFATSPRADDDKIARYILNQLSYNDNQNLLCYLWGPVSEGDKILATKEPLFNISCSGYVMYIDLYPTANLFHSVRYVFLAEPTNELFVFDAASPPLNFHDYRVVDTAYARFFFSVGNRIATIPSKTPPDISKNSNDSRYAVLMNGGYDQSNNHVRYWNDLSNIYITLTDVYGIPEENIYVLCSDGLDPAVDQSNGQNSNPDLDGDGVNDIRYSCILSNVDMVFTNLANNFIVGKLFVFTTDHGASVSGWNVVENLWNHQELTDAHFASLLDAFSDCEIICTFEPCFSGGFLDNIIGPPGPIVASSACLYNEYSYASSNLQYDEYVFHWTAAVKGHDAYGVPVNADINGDGRITMDEAYNYSKTHDVQNEHPQYGEYPNGTGSSLSLWVTSNPPSQPTKPLGPTLVIWHEPYSYTSSTTDPDGDQIFYLFNWGDGNNSGWLGPYASGHTVTGSHIWNVLGTYNVTVKARDTWGARSDWSEPLAVTITDNTPPEIPVITGPSGGKPGTEYLFNILTTDPQGQNIYYYVDWGDNTTTGWLGPYLSGTQIYITHSWAEKGNYTVKAKTKDTMDSESAWATIHVVLPTEYKFFISALLQHLFEKYPHLFPILRLLSRY